MTDTKQPGRRRVPITPERKEEIIALIGRWALDWIPLNGPNLEIKVENCLGYKLSRIGMFKHAEIEIAYDQKRNDLAKGKPPRKPRPVGEEFLANRVKNLEKERDELKAKVDNLLEMVARHHFNAQRKGVTLAELEAPLNQARAETQIPNTNGKNR